jgi:hypothetical protein
LLEDDDNEDKNDNTSPRRRDIEIIDLVNGSEDEDESVPRTIRRKSSTSKKNKTRHSPNSIPSTTFKSRKSVGFDSSAKKNTGLGKVKNDKFSKKGKDGNKTLTQMDFVRRYIPLPESDDDLKSYDEPLETTKNSPRVALPSNTEEIEEHRNEFPTPRKRRKLSNEPASVTARLPPNLPQTPQKIRKFEIPSSQTPETPRQEVLPPADVHNIPRLPLEAFSTKTPKTSQEQLLRELSDAQTQPSLRQHSTVPETAENSANENTNGPSMDSLDQSTASAFDSTLPPGTDELQQPSELPELPPSSFSKTVVYDTDDETEYSDFEDDRLLHSPKQANEPARTVKRSSNVEEDNCIPNSDDSNDLPLHVPNSGTDLDINYNTFSDTALPSDASLYYRRPAQYTQYPTEPVPMLNSQKMAELFPIEETEDPPSTPKAPPSLDKETATQFKNEHSDILCPQTQSDEAEKSTQMVPESSPIARKHEEETSDSMMPPPREAPVVLVESSQLVDRINRQNSSSLDTGPALPRLLSARDFLTDSVMESVPPPPWVLSSQDSVGEPYPEESRKRET